MEMLDTLDVNPKDIGRHVFEEGWYEGEITYLGIGVYTVEDAMVKGGYRQAGDRELVLRGNLQTNEGARGMDEQLRCQGPGAHLARGVLLALNIAEGASFADNPFRGTKVRVEYAAPRTTEKGTYNSFRRVVRVQG